MTAKLLDPKKWHEQADFIRSLRKFMKNPETARGLEALASRLDEMGAERQARKQPGAGLRPPKAVGLRAQKFIETNEAFTQMRTQEIKAQTEKTQHLRALRLGSKEP